MPTEFFKSECTPPPKKKNASPDEMLDLELEIDEAKKQVDKAKALEKAEKEKEKAAKKAAAPAKEKKGKK